MFTEFGACFDSLECYYEITNSVDAFDTALASWAYWMYKGFGDFTTTGGDLEGMYTNDGVPQALKVKALTRTYGVAYAGTPLQMYFDAEDGSFMTRWTYNSSIDGNTEVYMNPSVWYPNGYKLTFAHSKNGKPMEGVKSNTTDDGHYLNFWFWDPKAYNDEDCDILITPIKNATEMTGRILSEYGNYTMDYTFTD